MFLALLCVKLTVALGCCCGPRLKAWADAQQLATDTDDDAEETPLLRGPPYKKL
jgi:hypothetical protein